MNSTARRIQKLLDFDPSLSDAAVGRAMGISRQSVGKYTRGVLKGVRRERDRVGRRCAGCNVRIQRKAKTGMCRACLSRSFIYEFTCHWCGKECQKTGGSARWRRSRSSSLQRSGGKAANLIEFCSRRCVGLYRTNLSWDQKRAERLEKNKNKKLESGTIE